VLLLGFFAAAGSGRAAQPLLVRYPAEAVERAPGLAAVRLVDGSAFAWGDSATVARARAAGIDVSLLAPRRAGESYAIVYTDPQRADAPLAGRGQILWRGGFTIVIAYPDACRSELLAEGEILPILDRPIHRGPMSVPRLPVPADEPDPLIASMVDRVSGDRCVSIVESLQGIGSRRSDSGGGFAAAESVAAAFRSFRLTDVSFFDYNAWCDDVVAVQTGAVVPEEIVLIGAHYDSYSRTGAEPGADDNATGVAAVLEAARILSSARFERTLLYIAFSGEEQGLIGSEAWAADARGRGLDIRAAINIDMIGYVRPGDTRDLDLISDARSIPLMQFASAATALYLDGYPAVEGSFSGGNSDQQSFWDAGYPALSLHEDSADPSPYLHTPQDRLGISVNDFDFFRMNVQAAVAVVASLARPLRVLIRHEPIDDPPSWLDGYPIRARITSTAPFDPDSVRVLYRADDRPEIALPMEAVGDSGDYEARIPRCRPGTRVVYSIRARDVEGRTGSDPVDAPLHLHSFEVARRVVFADDFQTEREWVVGDAGDGATTGIWTRAVPIGTGTQPGLDAGGDSTGLCFLTANGLPGGAEGEADVDGGRTSLTTPRIDLSGLLHVDLEFRRWFVDETHPDDTLRVLISSDDGLRWRTLRTVTRSARDWGLERIESIDSLVPPTDRMRLRFVVEDAGEPSLLEAAIDDVVLRAVSPRMEAAPAPVTRIVQILPNPFLSRVAIVYDVLSPAHVRLEVFDAGGRRVARLIDAPQEIGRREVVWDGKDGRGRDLPAGVYWARLDAGRESSVRLVRIR
jgi:hypothetical protein